MIKNLQQIIDELRPEDPVRFKKWITHKIDAILKESHIPNLIPYELNSSFGILSIKSASEITLNNFEVVYDF